MKKNIFPCFWFDPETASAQSAADFYREVFRDAKITSDTDVVVNMELFGQKVILLNGGPQFRPNPSISLFMVFETMEEIDQTWQKLTNEGFVLMPLDKYEWSEKYGWVQDKYGINWQLTHGKISDVGQKFAPLLFFTGAKHGKAEEAVNLYTSVFKDSSIDGILKYTKEDQNTYAHGKVKHAQFKLHGHTFMAMDSGVENDHPFSEGVSIMVECSNQVEIDYYWEKLTADGGEESMCGWLKDKFDVSWQILPDSLLNMVTHSDKERSKRVMDAFMQMKKFDIATLEKAFEGKLFSTPFQLAGK
jgi:predicted 3-demethylubiquinone-9 3-methyltransferase (glyoxalase superfamily)